MRILIITTVRDEGPFLLDWIAHHRAAGVTDFLIYSNDCSDGTEALLDSLAPAGVVHVPQEVTGKKTPQWQALKAAWDHPLREAADWILVSDCDEYVSLAEPLNGLPDLTRACPDSTDAIALPWRFFGNNGVRAFEDRPVTEQFQRAAPESCPFPLNATYFKTLLRNAPKVQKLGVHRPKFRKSKQHAAANWCDGGAKPLPALYAKAESRISLHPLTGTGALARLNHYSLRSAESFLVKRARGLPNHTDRDIDLAYWVERNFNTEEDTRIQRMAPATRTARGELAALPGVEAAHAACVAAHRAKIATHLQTQDVIYFFSRLLLAPDTPVLPRADAESIYNLHRAALARAAQGEASA
ncbi:glycosyltransferase family 2 protein [Pseudoruegeria sp. SHC-113]|uniref:glycosyltransferase family 2 protein n=1 Tax=Pseudoruegeria sp. SHC-113 TaxID=2855439 RepID=UPI0021BAB0AE|nr:glycosyltransferase family 2 protein [Pseudoruegeria sp. SHC-113]MCT8160254.1 glycosyltransferase family 2 protein [Pseudoruegeria sp. SHC-113]